MSAPTSPPIPRQPIGATFAVAISVLGLFAILQVVAIAWHYVPAMKQQMAESGKQAQPQTAPQAEPVPTAPPVAMEPFRPDPVNSQLRQKATQLLNDADRNARIGEYESALKSLDQLEVLVPNDPVGLILRADVLQHMDQPADAVAALEDALKYPALPDAVRMKAERQLQQLTRYMDTTGQAVPKTSGASVDESGSSVRDEVGLQPGANLGIVDVRDKDAGKPGMKKFQVSVKARPGAKIDAGEMQVAAYFFDKTEDGEILPTESKVITQWISTPVDWAEEMPEILEITDILPDSNLPGSAAANGSPGRTYAGYIVAVYYNKELQDFRSEPASLQKKFPVQLYLPSAPPAGQ